MKVVLLRAAKTPAFRRCSTQRQRRPNIGARSIICTPTHAYAHAPNRAHLPAWAAFDREAHTGAVGIFHETYMVKAGHYEAIYANMPQWVCRRRRMVAASGRRASARGRLDRYDES